MAERRSDDFDFIAHFRLNSTVNPETGCFNWNGTKLRGYGVINYKGKDRRVHTVAWDVLYGPIPPGTELDHRCHVGGDCLLVTDCPHRSCWNPGHLLPVSHQENTRRGNSPAGINARKTHCIRGHEFSPQNTYVGPKGERGCRTCRRQQRRSYHLSHYVPKAAR